MATERLRPGDTITVTVEADAPNAREDATRELIRWAREEGLTVDVGFLWPVRSIAEDGVVYHKYTTQVWTDQCAICGKTLGLRNYALAGHDRRAHGPCKGFDERRIADGFPDAKDEAELRRLVRHAMDRGE